MGLTYVRDAVRAAVTPNSAPTRYPSGGSGLTGGGAYLDLSRELSAKVAAAGRRALQLSTTDGYVRGGRPG